MQSEANESGQFLAQSASAASSGARDSVAPFGARYQILAGIGQGGMSLIHLAAVESAAGVQKLVVLKAMRPELLNDELATRMFLAEGRLAVRLNHANVVQTYEVALIDDRPVIVMEYLDGQPLSRILRRASEFGRPFSLQMRLHVLKHALLGLDYAHNLADYDGKPMGIVHRDVSPQNIFVSYDGHTKLLDFGIAKTLVASVHTEVGQLKGKIRYMAPEQMRSKQEVDRRADIFSAGLILWEALAGRRIWQDSSDFDVLEAVTQKGIPAPSSAHDDVDPQLEAICMRAVAMLPNDRYPSALAMLNDIDRALDERGGVKATQVSEFTSELFGDLRARRQDAIGRALRASGSFSVQSFAQMAALPDLSNGPPSGDSLDLARGESSRIVAFDSDELASAPRKVEVEPARRSLRPVWLGLIVLFGALSFVLGRVFRAEPAGAGGEIGKLDPRTTIAPLRPLLSPSAAPPGPLLETPSAPVSIQTSTPRARSSGVHRALVATAPPKASAAKAEAEPALNANASRRASGHPGAIAADCDPLFFVDDQGIRRIKRECL